MPHPATPGHVPDEAWSPRAVDSVQAPVSLPGYRDFVVVASGGDSVVYRAQQIGIDRPVAVKVLTAGPDGVPEARFQRELEITVRLGRAHPNIVTVLDTSVTADGRRCIVMEYYELGSLQDQLRMYGSLPASAVVAAGTVVADALAYAHGQGVLHRDVKPQNILVLPTSYVLADFGLARGIDAGHTDSLERFSYRHASPQVLDGELPTVADDVYSLGSTLFTLLDGRPPFAADDAESDSALAYLRRVRSELPRPIRSTDATPELLAIIDRCLAKDRNERFADASALRDALRGVVTEARVWATAWQPRILPRPRTEPSASGPVPSPSVAPGEPASPGPTYRPPAAAPPGPVTVGPAYDRPPAGDSATPVEPSVDPLVEPEAVAWPRESTEDRDVTQEFVEPEDPASGRTGRAWARVGVLAAVALLVGGVLGVGGSWLLARTGTQEQPPVRPLPTFTGALPSASSTLGLDPALDTEIVELIDQGSSISLRWEDPTDGEARFVVVQIDGAVSQPLLDVDPGTTTAVVPGLDPQADRYCFQVLVLANGSMGLSPMRCTLER